MILPPCLRPYRRLALVLTASLLVHALAIEGLVRWGQPGGGVQRAPALSVRLLPAPAQPAARSATAVVPQATPASAPLPAPQLSGLAAPVRSGSATGAATPAPAGVIAGALGLPLGQGQSAPLGDEPPARYRIVLPPPTTIEYTLSYAVPGRAQALAAGTAQLTWAPAADSYAATLASREGTLRSSGILGDDGILPVEADGANGATRFDRAAGTISFAKAAPVPMQRGVQDPLSVLVQLAAIGSANPGQLENGVEVFVGGAGEAGVVRFARVGEETIDGPAGKIPALHMAQVAKPGLARLDLWLAPAHHWLPVMMRTTNADGSTVTQVARTVR